MSYADLDPEDLSDAEAAIADAEAARLMSGMRGGSTMYTCVLCHNPTEFDDVKLSGHGGHCVCLRCYERETNSEPALKMSLRRELQQVLNGVQSQ